MSEPKRRPRTVDGFSLYDPPHAQCSGQGCTACGWGGRTSDADAIRIAHDREGERG